MITEGMFLVDRYEIIGKIGAGGMSDVYKAKDHILGRIVAIKVLKSEFSEDINFVTKFRTEAQSAAGLEHPNIVNIYDVGSENGQHFIVMEYVEGITLKTYIEKKGRLSFKEATSIAIQVARGIEAAHNKNITHRDIKPQNIIISTEGKVKVTDFGIARAISSNTISSDAMGSVHYASPEQARNGFVDGRSDIYSLGIVMYEMVTGRVPFDGDSTVAVAIQHLQEEMVEPSAYAPELPISYEKIVLKTTQKSPDRRYQTIGELLADLRQALVTPDEDFVVIAPLVLGNTRVINGEELDEIRNTAKETDFDGENGFASASDDEDDDDMYDDEDDENEDASGFLDPKMEKALTVAGIALAAVIVILILILGGNIISNIFHFGSSKPSQATESEMSQDTEDTDVKEVEMIDIRDMTLEEAAAALEKIGLNLKVASFEESDKADGTILQQSEKAGNMVKKGTEISVVVAGTDGKDAAVPNVVGALETDAVKSLEAKGFLVTRDFAPSDEVEEGRVISQTPEAGKDAKTGTYVTIVISEGKGKEIVPADLVGKDFETVKAKLESLGFKVNRIDVKSDQYPTAGTVVNVAGAGTQKEKDSVIDVKVSTGPEKETPATYTYNKTVTKDNATSYEYVLYDANGTEISRKSGSGNSVTISASDISTPTGKLAIKWYREEEVTKQVPSDQDENNDGVVDEKDVKTETVKEKKEIESSNDTVTFTEKK